MIPESDRFPHLSADVICKLQDYTTLFLQWNERIQLTATRDAGEFFNRHIIDSLELSLELSGKNGRLLDVGSGGGLPGIVLAIAHPTIQFTLLEPTKKKHSFLSAARRELGLTNVQNLAIRDDELVQDMNFSPYDYAVARAVWPLDVWLTRAKSLVRQGGVVFGMEARQEVILPVGALRRRYQLKGNRQRAIISMEIVREVHE